MGVLHVLSRNGDDLTAWAVDDEAAIAEAERAFADARSEGCVTYKTDEDGQNAEQIHAFDPSAERIVAHRPIVGG